MKKHIFVFISVFSFSLAKSFACDCDYRGSFLKMTNRTPFVALVKVTKYLTYKDIYSEKTPMSMEVEIVDIYKGQETRKTVTVWGDIGNLCRPYLSAFKEGQYYVIAFDNGNYGGGHPDEKDTDYSIFNCGSYWLAVNIETKEATGDIDSQDRKFAIIDLITLKSKLRKNGS
jgi:hypothetical protein